MTRMAMMLLMVRIMMLTKRMFLVLSMKMIMMTISSGVTSHISNISSNFLPKYFPVFSKLC